MWWAIGGAAAVLAFIGWVIYEIIRAPIISDLFEGITLEEDDDSDLIER